MRQGKSDCKLVNISGDLNVAGTEYIQNTITVTETVSGDELITGKVSIGVNGYTTNGMSIVKPLVDSTTSVTVLGSSIYMRGADNGYGLAIAPYADAAAGIQTMINNTPTSGPQSIPLYLQPKAGEVYVGPNSNPIGRDVVFLRASGQLSHNGAQTPLIFPVIAEHSTAAATLYNTSTGAVTPPRSGYYSISVWGNTDAVNQYVGLSLSPTTYDNDYMFASSNNAGYMWGSGIFNLTYGIPYYLIHGLAIVNTNIGNTLTITLVQEA